MGTWDVSLYDGDLLPDIKDGYYGQLYEGHTPEEAATPAWKELRLGEEDLPVFRLVLADIQWKLGQMTEDTLRNALEVLDNGAAMAEWEGASELDHRNRQHVLDRLRKKPESPQGPPKTVKRLEPEESKFRVGDVISIRFMSCFADRNPRFEMYRDGYFIVRVIRYTDHPTSCNRHPSIGQCDDLVVLDWMGNAIPDMEAFEDASMLDLKETLYWLTRSFITTGMYGVKDVQCTMIGYAQVKFSQVAPECAWLSGMDNWRATLLAVAMVCMTQHSMNND